MRCILATGWSLEQVLRLDVLTFNALMERIVKITYSDRADAAWVAVATTNAGMSGKTQQIKKITAAWEGKEPSELAEQAQKTGRDARGFMRDFNLMGGGRI